MSGMKSTDKNNALLQAGLLLIILLLLIGCGGGGGGGNGDPPGNDQDIEVPDDGDGDTPNDDPDTPGDGPETPSDDDQASAETVIVFNGSNGVYSTDVSGSNIRLLTVAYPNKAAIPFFLSPDGSHVACLIHQGFHSPEIGNSLLIASPIVSEFERSIDLPSYHRISADSWWSPDSNAFFYKAYFLPEDTSQSKQSHHTYLNYGWTS